jgi:hypothetical protein
MLCPDLCLPLPVCEFWVHAADPSGPAAHLTCLGHASGARATVSLCLYRTRHVNACKGHTCVCLRLHYITGSQFKQVVGIISWQAAHSCSARLPKAAYTYLETLAQRLARSIASVLSTNQGFTFCMLRAGHVQSRNHGERMVQISI